MSATAEEFKTHISSLADVLRQSSQDNRDAGAKDEEHSTESEPGIKIHELPKSRSAKEVTTQVSVLPI